jgi:RNA exonuclease 4
MTRLNETEKVSTNNEEWKARFENDEPRQQKNMRGAREKLTLRSAAIQKRSNMSPSHRSTSPSANQKIPTSPAYFGNLRYENYVALDCEMVGVGPGGRQSVLARVSIVGYHGNVLLDSYVRVEERVTDYRTFVSGVTMDHLRSSQAKSFGQVRSAVQSLLYRKILVGHGLENDLQVLRIHHPQSCIRDTSLFEPFMKVDYYHGTLRSRRLRELTAQQLGQHIQLDGESHDSIEDARAAMEVFKSVQASWEYMIGWQRSQTILHAPLCHLQSVRYAQTI